MGLCEFSRSGASPLRALANFNTMPHIAFCIANIMTSIMSRDTPRHRLKASGYCKVFTTLTISTGSRRTRQGFLQVRMGS